MTDNTELKRLAEACGNLNWRAIQENWCEWAIRDDHAYIATMRTKSAKHPGPCSEREAKAKFLCAMTPATVLALIDENEQLSKTADCWDRLNVQNKALSDSFRAERDQLKAENDALRKDADKWQIVERAMTQLQSDEQVAAIWSACSRILISVASGLNSGRSVVTEEGVTNGGVEIGDWRVTVERIDAAMGKGEQS